MSKRNGKRVSDVNDAWGTTYHLWDYKMLRKNKLGDDIVLTSFEMMNWLVTHYGGPIKPYSTTAPNPVPLLHEHCFKDGNQQSVEHWSQAELALISKLCNMSNWSVQLAPIDKKSSFNTSAPDVTTLRSLQSNKSRGQENKGYFIDYFGRPTFFYDPKFCVKSGYLTHALLPQFAHLRLYAKRPPQEFLENKMRLLTTMTICHMGLGFTYLRLPPQNTVLFSEGNSVSNASLTKEAELTFVYGNLINLAAHDFSKEKVLEYFSAAALEYTPKQITSYYKHVLAQTQPLKALIKSMRSVHPEHNPHRPIQLSNDPAQQDPGANHR